MSRGKPSSLQPVSEVERSPHVQERPRRTRCGPALHLMPGPQPFLVAAPTSPDLRRPLQARRSRRITGSRGPYVHTDLSGLCRDAIHTYSSDHDYLVIHLSCPPSRHRSCSLQSKIDDAPGQRASSWAPAQSVRVSVAAGWRPTRSLGRMPPTGGHLPASDYRSSHGARCEGSKERSFVKLHQSSLVIKAQGVLRRYEVRADGCFV